jgi:hypothetical protein
MLTITAAAAMLGVPETEVRDVLDSPAGDVIVTTDGVSYVHATVPDGAGATGLMFLSAPHDGYTPGFPVYTMPEEPEPGDVSDDDATGAERDAGVTAKDQLIDRARDLGITVSSRWGERRLLEEITAAEAAAAAAAAAAAEAAQVETITARAVALGIDIDDYTETELEELVAAAEAAAAEGGAE